jgi:hypothetical protein
MALNDQLLTHFKEKFGIVTVVNATFYEVDGKKPLISFDTLKMSNITSEGQQKEIRGGQGAELLLQYDFGRTATVEITDALVSMGSLEYLFGGTLTAGSFKALRRVEGVIATDDTLADPLDLDGDVDAAVKAIFVLADGTRVELPAAGTALYDDVDALEVAMGTANAGNGIPAGSKYILWYPSAQTEGEYKREMVLKATDFPPTVRMIGETIVLDADKGQKVAFQIEVPKLKLNANFTLSLDAEGDPSVFDFSGVALSHNGELLKVRQLGLV